MVGNAHLMDWEEPDARRHARPVLGGPGGEIPPSYSTHYFRMQIHELCRGYIVAYNLTDDESTIKFS